MSVHLAASAVDELYGDFEDLETGDKFTDGGVEKSTTASGDDDDGSDNDDDDDEPSKTDTLKTKLVSRFFALSAIILIKYVILYSHA